MQIALALVARAKATHEARAGRLARILKRRLAAGGKRAKRRHCCERARELELAQMRGQLGANAR